MVASGRWASQGRLVGRRQDPMVQAHPRGPAEAVLRRRTAHLLREEQTEKRQGSPVCSTRNSATVRRSAGPRGARDAEASAGCHAAPSRRNGSVCRGCRGSAGLDRRSDPALDCVCRQRCCAWGVATARQSSFSQLKLSVIQAKELISDEPHVACNIVVNACQEYEELSGLATAKLERKEDGLDACASTDASKACANSLKIHIWPLLKSRASRQEKASACNRNGAASDEHFL